MNTESSSEPDKFLEAQLRLLENVTQITKLLSATLELDRLLIMAVETIRETFSYFYVHVYLLDDNHKWAVIRAGTGIVGQSLIEHNHKVPIDHSTLIGRCIKERVPYIVKGGDEIIVKSRTQFLPDVNSAVVLPLINQNDVIGALEILDTANDVEFEKHVFFLRPIADHLAIAINNARHFSRLSQSSPESP